MCSFSPPAIYMQGCTTRHIVATHSMHVFVSILCQAKEQSYSGICCLVVCDSVGINHEDELGVATSTPRDVRGGLHFAFEVVLY